MTDEIKQPNPTTEPTAEPAAKPLELVDIWSRPGKWAQQRAYIFLAVNTLVYGALNVFLFWIQNGRLFDFSGDSYTANYRRSLVEMLLFPLNVQDTPVVIPIIGLVMAVIVIVPILISQLYGFRFAIVFAMLVAALGHLPTLSLFLIGCSFIAGTSKRWLSFKFGVALISLLPIVIYFYVATRGTTALQMKTVDPMLLYAPWLLAFLASAGMAASVLAIARLLKYRPGGILLSMIPFFAIPVALFTHYIGVDHLEFRLLSGRYAPDRLAEMPPIDVAKMVLRETMTTWQRYQVRDLRMVIGLIEESFSTIAARLAYDCRNEIIDACDRFGSEYRTSRFLPNAYYIRGMAEDMRYDQQLLTDDWRVRFHSNLVSSQSESCWQFLVETAPNSLYAQPARYRLAVLRVRKNRVTEAATLLDDLMKRLPTVTTKPAAVAESGFAHWRDLLVGPGEMNDPIIDLDTLHQQAEILQELIEYNADDPKFGNAPLVDLMLLDPNHPQWRSHILDLAMKYAGSKLHDNLIVLYATAEPDPNIRKKELARHAKEFADNDAGVLAMYELAKTTYELALVDLDAASEQSALSMYRSLVKDHSDYAVARLAGEELARIDRLKEQLR